MPLGEVRIHTPHFTKTAWKRTLLQKLTVTQLLKISSAFYECSKEPTISLEHTLVLSFHLLPCPPSDFLLPGSSNNFSVCISYSPYMLHNVFLIFITVIIFCENLQTVILFVLMFITLH